MFLQNLFTQFCKCTFVLYYYLLLIFIYIKVYNCLPFNFSFILLELENFVPNSLIRLKVNRIFNINLNINLGSSTHCHCKRISEEKKNRYTCTSLYVGLLLSDLCCLINGQRVVIKNKLKMNNNISSKKIVG